MATVEGERVGQYLLCREIGKGAMATVYEAEHVVLHKRVALKRMHPHLAVNPTSSARFFREGKAATRIRSPHVVEIFDVAVHEGVPYMVMDLLAGRDLAAVLRVRRKLPVGEIVDLLLPVLSAVHAAHCAGVVHRDLKPSNVFVAERPGGYREPVVLDFGISKLESELEGDLTASEVMLGTVHYMSPELTRGGKGASPKSDQYALGVILYEGVTGSKPFAGSTPYAVMHAIVSSRPVPPSAIDSRVPRALDDVVLRAMQRSPDKRFPSVLSLGEALLPWASAEARSRFERETGGLAPPSGGKDASRGTSRHRTLVGAASAAIVVLAVGASYGWRRAHGAPQQAATAIAPPPETVAADPPQSAAPTIHVPDEVPAPPASLPPLTVSAQAPRAPPRPLPAARTAASSPAKPPERGTNGALIVE